MSLPARTELEAIAARAGALALAHFRRVTAERKVDRTLVTAADREVEAALVAELGALLPDAGILEDARPVAGVVHLPCLGETYSAVGGAAWLNGAPLASLGAAGPVGDRFIVAHAHAHRRHRITYPGKVRSLGSTAYHIALVARGAADGALVGHAHLWDLAGPGAILAAVGGGYEYLGGGPVDLGALADGRRAPDYVLAGAPAALAALRPLLAARA